MSASEACAGSATAAAAAAKEPGGVILAEEVTRAAEEALSARLYIREYYGLEHCIFPCLAGVEHAGIKSLWLHENSVIRDETSCASSGVDGGLDLRKD